MRIAALQRLDGPQVNPVSRTHFFTHDRKTPRAVLFFQGYTNSTFQFSALGRLCHERGDNVLIPRAPHHGLLDRMTSETARLTEAELLRFASQAVDMAAGLGERLVVCGLSMGGVLTAWAAQERAEVDLAVLLAPAFGVAPVPTRLLPLAAPLIKRLPNWFVWWDAEKKDAPGPQMHAYPRLASRGLANILSLSLRVQAAARRRKPAAPRIQFVLNESDTAIDPALCARMAQAWQAHGADVRTHTFARVHNLDHDIVDPLNPRQNTALVYPILLDLLT